MIWVISAVTGPFKYRWSSSFVRKARAGGTVSSMRASGRDSSSVSTMRSRGCTLVAPEKTERSPAYCPRFINSRVSSKAGAAKLRFARSSNILPMISRERRMPSRSNCAS